MKNLSVHDVAADLAVSKKENAERWKTAFNEFANDQKSIEQAIQNATPEQMLELKKAEQAFEIQMKELDVDVFELEVADKQHARGMFSKDWTARIIGLFTIAGFLGYIFLVTLQPPEQNSEALINLVLGYLGGLASAIISFYFGASHTPDKGE